MERRLRRIERKNPLEHARGIEQHRVTNEHSISPEQMEQLRFLAEHKRRQNHDMVEHEERRRLEMEKERRQEEEELERRRLEEEHLRQMQQNEEVDYSHYKKQNAPNMLYVAIAIIIIAVVYYYLM